VSSRGTQRENYVKDWLEENGWWVCRAAGSLGDADLVAMKGWPATMALARLEGRYVFNGKLLIEVKSTARSAFAGFGPKDRAELLAAGEKAGADVVLCWVPPSPGRKIEMYWIWPEDWPKARVGLAA
jgi:hypothetical protein